MFLHVYSTSLLKTLWGKGEIARYEQFLLFSTAFSTPLRELSTISIKVTIVVCKLKKFVVWQRVKPSQFFQCPQGRKHKAFAVSLDKDQTS